MGTFNINMPDVNRWDSTCQNLGFYNVGGLHVNKNLRASITLVKRYFVQSMDSRKLLTSSYESATPCKCGHPHLISEYHQFWIAIYYI